MVSPQKLPVVLPLHIIIPCRKDTSPRTLCSFLAMLSEAFACFVSGLLGGGIGMVAASNTV
jgi:hypothetical protein